MNSFSPFKWFGGWRKTATFFPQELSVLRRILSERDDRCNRLYRQAESAPFVTRELPLRHSFRALIPYLPSDAMLIECDADVESPELEIIDVISHRAIRFHVKVLRGGFLAGLFGVAVDGAYWPKLWDVEPDELETRTSPIDWLPPALSDSDHAAIIDKLCRWCAASCSAVLQKQDDRLRVTAPATEHDIVSCEARLGTVLPEQYKEFLRICDGLTIRRGRPYEILGASDAYMLAEHQPAIAITPLYEDGCVAINMVQGSSGDVFFCASDRRTPEHMGDLRQHVRDSLLWVESV